MAADMTTELYRGTEAHAPTHDLQSGNRQSTFIKTNRDVNRSCREMWSNVEIHRSACRMGAGRTQAHMLTPHPARPARGGLASKQETSIKFLLACLVGY